MRWKFMTAAFAVGFLCASSIPASAAALTAADFTFTLSRIDSSGDTTTLSDDDLKTFFSAARCACPTSVLVELALTSSGKTNIGSTTIDAQIEVGSDCDDASADGCDTVGSSLTLSSSQTSTSETISTASFFGGQSCSSSATPARVWAVIRQDGTRLDSLPSEVINLGGDGATAPTSVKAQSADQGVLVSWTATGDSSVLQGHQVLCSPERANPPAAAYDTCAALPSSGGDGPFASLDAKFVCSDLVSVGTNSVRVRGLQNGQAYQLAVVAVGIDGTASKASAVVTATPAPTYGFDDLYRQSGGTATGCELAPAGSQRWGALAAIVLLGVGLRRRRAPTSGARMPLRRGLGLGLAIWLLPQTANAQTYAQLQEVWTKESSTEAGSPRGWNLELRFGPYRPDVDSEFAARGSSASPYAKVFSSSRRLMTQFEVDRQVSHRGGTWAVGVSVGYMSATAAALEADLATSSGDSTSLRLVPLSVSLVYRADLLRKYAGLAPYAKLGLDCTVWSFAGSADSSGTTGRTFGWHSAAGVALDLSTLDPEAARTMDNETGVNQTAIFFEVARYSLNDFGSSSALHVGDLTWLAGIMFEL